MDVVVIILIAALVSLVLAKLTSREFILKTQHPYQSSKSKVISGELAIAGARVSLRVAYGVYDGKEVLQLINPHGKIVLQRISDGSEGFWENTYNDAFKVIEEASERLWPKQ